jgi:hypothetical protein
VSLDALYRRRNTADSANIVIAGQLNTRLRIVRPVVWVGYAISALGYGLCIKYLQYGGGIANQIVILIVLGLGVGLSLAVPLLCLQAVSLVSAPRLVTRI